MKLEKTCTLAKKIAETEDTKLFYSDKKMSFSERVYYILHPDKENTHLGLKPLF